MKIGLVRRGYSPTGGAEIYLRRFAEAAVAAGHQVILFAEQWPRADWPFEHVQVHSGTPRQFASALAALRAEQACDFLFSLERVFACDAYRAGDGVHAAWLERRAQFEPFWKPWVRRFNGKHAEMLAIERQLFSDGGARLVIANSAMVKAEIERHFAYPAERIHVIHNGVPVHVSAPELRTEARRELSLNDEDYVLLFAGSGWERKGLRFAIEAVKALPPKHTILLVAGRGSARGLPRSHRVRYLGASRDLSRLYAAADTFLLPTLYEPFSNACLEAAVGGLPVITTRHNGFAEVIEPGVQGEIVNEPHHIQALVQAIEKWREAGPRVALQERLPALRARSSIAENVRATLAVIERNPRGSA
jgi:UDP-glucose:(heptosyl)LPS alpha-1,3-glucosyltransferase